MFLSGPKEDFFILGRKLIFIDVAVYMPFVTFNTLCIQTNSIMEAPFDSTKSSHDLMNFSGSASDMLAAMQVSLPYNSGVVLQVFHAYSLGTQVDFEAFLLYAYDKMI